MKRLHVAPSIAIAVLAIGFFALLWAGQTLSGPPYPTWVTAVTFGFILLGSVVVGKAVVFFPKFTNNGQTSS